MAPQTGFELWTSWLTAIEPLPLPGTGAIAEYAELGNVARGIVSYQPDTFTRNRLLNVVSKLKTPGPTNVFLPRVPR